MLSPNSELGNVKSWFHRNKNKKEEPPKNKLEENKSTNMYDYMTFSNLDSPVNKIESRKFSTFSQEHKQNLMNTLQKIHDEQMN